MARKEKERRQRDSHNTSSNSSDYRQFKPPTGSFIKSKKKIHLSSQRFSNFRERNKTCCGKSNAIREYRREGEGNKGWKHRRD